MNNNDGSDKTLNTEKPVNIDPRCIQEALRMYFQPIKNEDPQLDFYTIYKREATEYDTEYMKKYNEDLNTTLIFAGLFSAVSSAFVIDVQSKLEPDSGERSEAYLRAILLSLNKSIAPDEHPMAPPSWNGPPTEIVATSDLLYASLLMSLLAAFVAMLGKQWLNRYLRHTGGSMVERCGDRQRKYDGLERWPFHLFVGGLSIMLQIALLLLTCGLSRYMWSVNTSVARIVISFTALGVVFFIGIVVAGTSSYECPFQTPASIALRNLRDSRRTQKLLASLSPLEIVFFIGLVWRGARTGLSQGVHRVRKAMFKLPSWDISLSSIISAIRSICKKVGRQIITLFSRIGLALRNAKKILVQGIRRSKSSISLPMSIGEAGPPPQAPRTGLLVPVRDLSARRDRNAANARCVCWVIRYITDPEAIDSAIRLAGSIRWFDGDVDVDPPFDFIVSTFRGCFDSAMSPYPGMVDRAYFSGKAILHINIAARLRSGECASRYPIPSGFFSPLAKTGRDLYEVLRLCWSTSQGTFFYHFFLDGTPAHSLWVSNLLVDMARADPASFTEVALSKTSKMATSFHAVDANILLAWYMHLGGYVEEETFWAEDKSDSLGAILSHLSRRILDVIPDVHYTGRLTRLLDTFLAWENRPPCLTPMVYQWCSAISENIKRFKQDGIGPRSPQTSPDGSMGLHLPRQGDSNPYVALLFPALAVAFRQIDPNHISSDIRLTHTRYHEMMFENTFASDDDGVIADVVFIWVVDPLVTPSGPCTLHLIKLTERGRPFSPRLRRMIVCALQGRWPIELEAAGVELVLLLNHLEVDVEDMDDMVSKLYWVSLLAGVLRSPEGQERLSSRYWLFLGKLISMGARPLPQSHDLDMKIMKSLEDVEDWEKLEAWLLAVWGSWYTGGTVPMEDVERATIKLFLQQPTSVLRFKDLCADTPPAYPSLFCLHGDKFQWICDKMQAEQLCLELPPQNPASEGVIELADPRVGGSKD